MVLVGSGIWSLVALLALAGCVDHSWGEVQGTLVSMDHYQSRCELRIAPVKGESSHLLFRVENLTICNEAHALLGKNVIVHWTKSTIGYGENLADSVREASG